MTFSSTISYLKRNYVNTICGVVIIVCTGIHFVRSEQVERLEANFDDLNVRRTRILKNFKFGSELADDLAEMRVMKEAAESRLFRPENLAVNQRYFYQIESSTGVKLEGLQQIVVPPPSGKKNKKARNKAAKAKYREIAYDMNVTGTYESVLKFLREVEGGDAFVRLDSLRMAPARVQDVSGVTVQLMVEVLGVK